MTCLNMLLFRFCFFVFLFLSVTCALPMGMCHVSSSLELEGDPWLHRIIHRGLALSPFRYDSKFYVFDGCMEFAYIVDGEIQL